jgi:choline kinase
MIEIDGRTILSRLIEALSPHVPVICVVVGYREDLVTEYCSKHHPEVVIARNPAYRSTNTAFSFSIGARIFNGRVIYLDGDIVISPDSLELFITKSRQADVVVGVTPAKSQQPVFVTSENGIGMDMVAGFSREVKSDYEWGNVFSGPSDILKDANGYVYERLEALLPLPCAPLNLHEVDTAEDLELAIPFTRSLDLTQFGKLSG